MKKLDRKADIAEEAFMILHSGEIPEIAYNGSLYYLREDPDGPGLELDGDEILSLKLAVVERYRTIILRDLDPGNRDKGIYRGLARAVVNWQRLHKFCTSQILECGATRAQTAAALVNFLQQEIIDVKSSKRASSINCSQEEIAALARGLGLAPAGLPAGWQDLCPEEETPGQ
jgi:hypothetical protein